MARPKRTTVDYYPHYVKCGRTIYILEARFGNDGYAFWFKVLEVLGESEGHFYDCSVSSNWEYLLAKTRVNAQTATEIIGVLINLGKIDKELWEKNRVIWIENFVNNLTEVYRTRRTELPQKPVFKAEKQPSDKVISEKTPDKEPFFAGTYFPKESSSYGPSFKTILKSIVTDKITLMIFFIKLPSRDYFMKRGYL